MWNSGYWNDRDECAQFGGFQLSSAVPRILAKVAVLWRIFRTCTARSAKSTKPLRFKMSLPETVKDFPKVSGWSGISYPSNLRDQFYPFWSNPR
jgi:hypothetical protein